ncbi:NAD(P)/FAD-dependent oxidoreductase [Jatrophihabitans telluris]|uniref:NAD(P)/FAD-dependent oxidoreductase n=1 Tax=Jatrophihabitans telluris TaxID=2038343 RepID=A0ABY4QTJ2_9ACTN|nr:FAD-dependent oxidoreductase [Jatrophihabitans telluris]UQX86988.1 NAD(P)/FAD-dependent oxidoreductase [Jatrophihabitans telluris]
MTPSQRPVDMRPDVLVIGAGPAGLTAAADLAGTTAGEVLVLDREENAGGIPRHSDHLGYGVRDLHRMLTGPDYARRLVDAATAAGATIRTRAMVTGWDADGSAEVTTPTGRLLVRAKATVLATGARERPRSARLVPGDRPRGVLTTGQLQNLVHLHHADPGHRAVVVGGELVSWSAVLTLREAGCRTVLLTTEYPSPESYAVFNLAGRLALRTPVATGTRVVDIIGEGRVRAVVVESIETGQRRTVECDTVVFTGDWIPDHELARLGGLELDTHTRGPRVDTALRTSRPGFFAAGNLVHPVDTADISALDGRHVAAGVRAYLEGARPSGPAALILADKPFRWIAPNVLRPDDPAPPRGRLLLWTDELVRRPHISVRQNGYELAHARLRWPASPGRVVRVPSSLLDGIDPAAGDVTVGLR